MLRDARRTPVRFPVSLGWVVCCLLLAPTSWGWAALCDAPASRSSEAPLSVAPPQKSAEAPQRPDAARVGEENEEIRAQLTPRQRTVIGAEIPAKIVRINVAEGEAFTQGKVLVEFDCTLFQTRLRKAVAEVDAASKRVEVHSRLMELGSLSPLELELDQLELARNVAEVETQRAMVHRCRIYAPFAGHVISLQAQPFQYVTEGQHLLDILNNADLELAMIVPSRWLPRLTPGAAFTVHIDETGRDYPARVVRPVPQVDAVSQSIKVIARLDGHFPELISGMNGRIRFPADMGVTKP
ncbi:MAG: efflux RND transporter periplasmic adaptor subunit [Magnetococcales bacterium]|nr:efflux RND transporter periplasmic adaptor subunit [Magnetococcales bacterium]